MALRIAVPSESRRPLVPDLAFVAFHRMRGFEYDEIQAPHFAPTVAVEILSRGDDARDIKRKVDVYLRAGSELAIVVGPLGRTSALYDARGKTVLSEGGVLSHPALPDFTLAIQLLCGCIARDALAGPSRAAALRSTARRQTSAAIASAAAAALPA